MKAVILFLLLAPFGMPQQSADDSPEATAATVEGADQPDAQEPCATDPQDLITAGGDLKKPESFVEAEELYLMHPHDEWATRQLVDASVALAEEILSSSCAPPKWKYYHANRLFSLALELDPENVEAQEGMADVEAIHETLDRPALYRRPE